MVVIVLNWYKPANCSAGNAKARIKVVDKASDLVFSL